jgi:hypothetical protein
MEKYKLDQLKNINEKYKLAAFVSYGSPDQYQFRQNELMRCLAEFILTPFWQWENEQAKKELNLLKTETEDGTGLQA